MNDVELEQLMTTWKEDEMTSVQQCMKPGRWVRQNRMEVWVGLALVGTMAVSAVHFAVRGVTGGVAADVAVAAVVLVAAGVLLQGVNTLRRRSKQSQALLVGTPLEVAQGERMAVHSQVCSIRGRTANTMMVLCFVLLVTMSLAGMLPASLAVVLLGSTAGVWAHSRRVRLPRLLAERDRLDELIVELSEAW